eukprot:TRINITY_DN18259_c0_g1_i1.p1 TRINITY_DN18259_c0_g1~~TRINITY_DN18259_c0_g1_i1.p1  ORF type:complete len:465 (+),score=119.23 TRINITY_DN18259_c0_g1_i1:176-1570(+)
MLNTRYLLVVSALLLALAWAECKDGEDCDDAHHTHFKTLLPLDRFDWAGFISIGLFTAVAAGGGIGGGGVLVPLLILVMGFAIKSAIPLSNITILGGAIFHIVRNMSRRHPTANRPLIDWSFITLMQPMLIAGAVIGSFVNKVVSDWFLAILLFVILILTARRTWSNGVKQWAKEDALMAQGGLKDGLMEDPGCMPLVEEPATERSPALQAILDEDAHLPMAKIFVIALVFAGVLAINVSKGSPGKFNPFNIECGSFEFWVLSLAVVPWCLTGFSITRYMLVAQHNAKLEAGFEFLEGDIEWDEDRTAKLPMVCLGAGVMAGMFGIGGGLINGPLMVELGVLPDVASATSATMILFTSATATVCYILFDILNFEYAQVLFPLGFCATFIGQILFNKIMEIFPRKSLIVFTIAFIVGCSAILMGIEGGFTFHEFWVHGGDFFHPICASAVVFEKEITLDHMRTHN